MSSSKDQTQNGKVLQLEPRAKGTQQIDQIEAYWSKIRGNRLVPSRCEIDPRGLEGVLSNAFILERIAGGLARFRIAGSHLTEFTGLELRQMPISALFLPGSREILSEALQSAFDEPTLIRMAITSPAGFGRERLDGEMILLPLRSDLGDIDRILGGLVFNGKTGRTPRRIEIMSQSRKSLIGFAGPRHFGQDLPSSRTPSRVTGTKSDGLAPSQRPRVDKETPEKNEKSYLKLVVSNS